MLEALQQLRAGQRDLQGQIVAVRNALQPPLTQLEEEFEFFRKRFDRFEQDTRERFLIRDTDAALRELAGPIAAITERLLEADAAYLEAEDWFREVGEWRAMVQNFWNLASRWHALLTDDRTYLTRDIMEVTPADLEAVKGKPGAVVPNDFAGQQAWRLVAVIAGRHRRHAPRIMGAIHDRATRGLHDRPSPF